MSDVNQRAVNLAKVNLKQNSVKGEVILSNGYENISNTYDLIITNPPIRAGKEVVLNILSNAKKHLNNEGELWFVIRKDHGAKSIEKILKNNYELNNVKKSKGFYIYQAKSIDN